MAIGWLDLGFGFLWVLVLVSAVYILHYEARVVTGDQKIGTSQVHISDKCAPLFYVVCTAQAMVGLGLVRCNNTRKKIKNKNKQKTGYLLGRISQPG